MPNVTARVLNTHKVDKVWGRAQLPEPFAGEGHADGTPVGEIWFTPPAELESLLVKYLFTSDKLSVQVHPADHQAPAGANGKEECWLVLDADPGAQLAIGFRERFSTAEVEAAAKSGAIEDMLAWHNAKAGDFFYIPAGTVHAIGPGLTLVEVQQNSDVTYRLYDYGRPRDLHLADSLRVAELSPYDPAHRRTISADENTNLVNGALFTLDQICGAPGDALQARYDRALLILPLEGSVQIANSGDDKLVVTAGQCAVAHSLASADLADCQRALLASGPAIG